MQATVLVVAAHPDDEVLGCGGTISRMGAEGHAVHVLILAEGVTSRDVARDASGRSAQIAALAAQAKRANETLGGASLQLLGFPDNRMDGVALLDLVKVVEDAIARHAPRIVLTHGSGDVNIDHQQVHDAVVTACRPTPGQAVKELLFFEVPSSTEWRPPSSRPSFAPNCYVDISAHLAQKLAALQAYAGELREFPHPRSLAAVEALAHWRGASVGVEAAEAFILGRSLR